MDLHGQIMNIRETPPKCMIEYETEKEAKLNNLLRLAYKNGHRDARHAAAELVSDVIPIPIDVLDMLSTTSMVDHHSDNGPGITQCPACGEHIPMKWDTGARMDDPDSIKHLENCPVTWAKSTYRAWLGRNSHVNR